jgi:hypothetical protein
VKQRIYSICSFKKFSHAAVRIGGIELAHKVREGQFNIANLMKDMGMRVAQIWKAALAT